VGLTLSLALHIKGLGRIRIKDCGLNIKGCVPNRIKDCVPKH